MAGFIQHQHEPYGLKYRVKQHCPGTIDVVQHKIVLAFWLSLIDPFINTITFGVSFHNHNLICFYCIWQHMSLQTPPTRKEYAIEISK